MSYLGEISVDRVVISLLPEKGTGILRFLGFFERSLVRLETGKGLWRARRERGERLGK